MFAWGEQYRGFSSLAPSGLLAPDLQQGFEAIRRMSQVLSVLGDAVGGVIDNEATGNR